MNKALHQSKNCGYLYDGKSSHGLSATGELKSSNFEI